MRIRDAQSPPFRLSAGWFFVLRYVLTGPFPTRRDAWCAYRAALLRPWPGAL